MTDRAPASLEPLTDIDARLEVAQASIKTHLASGDVSPRLAAVLAHLAAARRVLGEAKSNEAEE